MRDPAPKKILHVELDAQLVDLLREEAKRERRSMVAQLSIILERTFRPVPAQAA